jgi:hypothetical protein
VNVLKSHLRITVETLLEHPSGDAVYAIVLSEIGRDAGWERGFSSV